jgi:hypothetical protein
VDAALPKEAAAEATEEMGYQEAHICSITCYLGVRAARAVVVEGQGATAQEI